MRCEQVETFRADECGAATTPATLAEAINHLCREAARLAAQQDYPGAMDCFDRASALMDEQARQAAINITDMP
jgi:hypothetical protein